MQYYEELIAAARNAMQQSTEELAIREQEDEERRLKRLDPPVTRGGWAEKACCVVPITAFEHARSCDVEMIVELMCDNTSTHQRLHR